ncbi:ABC transporter permease [candidate division KSB1 bacterium]|nr:ABC transporter permease [candidate division KSB1 bacterium]
MLRNYIKIAYRNFRLHKGYAFINVSGLTLGTACFILIILFIQDEWSYDRYHKNANRIYRIESIDPLDPKAVASTRLQAPMAPALVKDFPEVVSAVRLWPKRNVLLNRGNKKFYEDRLLYVDPSIFDVFTFPLSKGDPKVALETPNSIVITETMAKKYFGNEDPMGQMLTVDNARVYQVTGVSKDIPRNSHFRFDFLIPFSNVVHVFGNAVNEWNLVSAFCVYLLLQPNYSPTALAKKLPDFNKRYMAQKQAFYLKPLTSIHLHSHLPSELEPNSDIRYIYIFSAVALLILFIACINFTNLATARSARRAMEVGMRKVVGAYRWQLIGQFLSEAILLSFIALLLAVLLVELFLPAFNDLVDKNLSVDYSNIAVLLGLGGGALLVGLLAGSYPAFFLSAFRPVYALKSATSTGSKSAMLRKGLVVFQFTISVALIASTFIIYNQMKYIQKKNLGFKKERLLVLKLNDPELKSKSAFVKRELLQIPSVTAATASRGRPGKEGMATEFKVEGLEKPMWINTFGIDYDFVETYEMEMAEGRNFSEDFVTDREAAFLVNETAVRAFGWTDPVFRKLEWFGITGEVVGVIRDFHFKSLHEKVEPLVLYVEPKPSELALKVHTDDIASTLASLKKKWEQLSPDYPFDYFFLDEDFDRLYRAEDRLGKIFGYFAIFTILIASLGLFGLAAFTTEQRTKEIGIRKVMGASIPGIVLLITKNFAVLVFIAISLGTPIAYYGMNQWLQDFAYRIEMGLDTFLLAGIIALVITLITVSYQSLKAALANPVEALRYE